MTTPTINPSQKACVLITGASRGIGQAIAIEMAQYFADGSLFVLVARDALALNATCDNIRSMRGSGARVEYVALDLANPTDEKINEIFQYADDANAFDVAVIVHNVGTIGDISLGADACGDLAMWSSYYATNVFGVARLNVSFLAHFAGRPTVVPIVVNITSKCSLVPYASFTMYCTSRAAREMYFNVLAMERPDVLVVNYSPGVVDTAMTVDVQARSADAGLRDTFRSMREAEQMLQPGTTAAQLLRVLAGGDFKSGDHVDYYQSADVTK